MIRIVFQRRKCIGCNACVEQAPAHWVMSQKDGKSYLRKSVKKGEYYVKHISAPECEENLRAARYCPARIIRVQTF
ncbi:MAG: ferredoxin [Haliscomenobacteraceae bacterium CHB4]|nr:hypothetical protein [Saprospiraceae bacterium]MCE7924599.1 ferredoxin [Haliscomenobacteraceae bacterium CHB4]